MSKQVRFPKATVGDILLSLLFPGLGVILGLVALMRSQLRRGWTMIAISVVMLGVLILITTSGNRQP